MRYLGAKPLHEVLPLRDFRGLISLGITVTIFVFLVNVVLLAVSTKLPTSATGGKLLFRGDCDYASSRSTIAHLAINILATLILSASNAAMQCLSAPSRADIDRTHCRGICLDVGVSSLRNLYYSDIFRQVTWFGLLLTTVPLHLVYNSVFIQSSETNAYNALVVSQDFLQGAWSTIPNMTYTLGEYFGTTLAATQQIQSEAHSYTKLSWDECGAAYAAPLVKDWGNLVVVTNVSSIQDSPINCSVLTSFWYTPSVTDVGSNLFLSDGETFNNLDSYGTDNKIVVGVDGNLLTNTLWPFRGTWTGHPSGQQVVKMEYCLAKPTPSLCTIELFQPFLETVIVANILKILCFALILYGLPGIAPLVTFGDAVASFLARPDPFTAGGRAVDRDWVDRCDNLIRRKAHEGGTLFREEKEFRDRWVVSRTPWIRAPSRSQRYTTSFVCFALLVFSAVFLHLANDAGQSNFSAFDGPAPTLQRLWANGLGNIYPEDVFTSTLSWSVGASLLAANAPQLIMSFLYLSYNQYFTLMCVSAEAQSFCVTRQYLRVSRPRGQQRSSYWLGLPFSYSIPLMVVCTALHWALSQSLFIAELNVVSPREPIDPTQNINAVGYSLIGLIILCGLGALMTITLLVVGIVRIFPSGMPLLSSNSLAISAACHGHYSPGKMSEHVEQYGGEAEAEAEAPLKYGVTAVTREKRGRVGFSSGDVQPLQAGWIYGRPEVAASGTVEELNGPTEASPFLRSGPCEDRFNDEMP